MICLQGQPLLYPQAVPGACFCSLNTSLKTSSNNAEARLRQVAGRIELIEDIAVQADITAAAAVLAGVALGEERIEKILVAMKMRESVIYQAWRQEALAEGRLEGIKIGAQQSQQQTARNLLAIGLDPQQIAAATGLTLEQVQQLQPEADI